MKSILLYVGQGSSLEGRFQAALDLAHAFEAHICSMPQHPWGGSYLVAGAYGHTRFREAILGGVSREVIQHSILPLLAR